MSIDPRESFPAFYNAVLGPRGFYYPPHLLPLQAAISDLRIPKLMQIIGPGSGKSQAISVMYPCFVLGRRQDETILEISSGESLPMGFMKAAMGIIEHSKHFKRIFPNAKPDKRSGWSTDAGLYLQGRPFGDPDPSFFACGIGSKALTGKHAKNIIIDDVHDVENSASPNACKKVIDIYYNSIVGRADPAGARWLVAGRRWSEWDLYGHLMQAGDFVTIVLPAERPGQKQLYCDVYVPYEKEPGVPYECVFTEGGAQEVQSDLKFCRKFRAFYGIDPKGQGFYWPASESKRADYFTVKRNRPAEAASVYQCDPAGRNAGIYMAEDFRVVPMGRFDRLMPGLIPAAFWKPGTRVIQGWDTAHEQNPDSDYSACITALVSPCTEWHSGEDEGKFGKPDAHYDVLIVDAYRDKLKFDALIQQVRMMAQLWEPSFVAIEKTVGSTALIQSLAHSMNIVPIPATRSKRARATIAVGSGAASVQGWMRLGRVKFWEEAPWLSDLKQEMINFSGDGTGHDDFCDAIAMVITQAILLGSGSAMMPSEYSPPDPVPEERAGFAGLTMIQTLADIERERNTVLISGVSPALLPSEMPQFGMCGNCRFRDKMGICEKRGHKVVNISTCELWTWNGVNK